MLRLRSIAGKSIGCNYDPSHMFWQGIDPIAAIRVLGDCIFHVHAKDTQIYERNLPLTGVLDTKSYTDERNRAWIFRTCGYGHDDEWWKEFVSHPAHVRLRLRALDRARGQPDVARRRPDQGGFFPERPDRAPAARRRLVGLGRSRTCASTTMSYRFRQAICNEAFEKWPFADACKAIRKAGYDGIEIAPFTLAEKPTDITAAQRAEYRDIMRFRRTGSSLACTG